MGKGRMKRGVQGARWKEARRKFARVLKIGRRAAPMIVRSAIGSSLGYGAEITGITDGMLKGWRVMVAKSFGAMGGRSTTARLALESSDLGRNVVVEAVMSWICAWWDGLMPKEDMREAWRYAVKKVGMAPRPNAEVRGRQDGGGIRP